MAEIGKTPDAGHVEGLEIANHHKGNIALFLAEVQLVKPPQPTQKITPEHGECLRQLVNLAIKGHPAPGVDAWLDLTSTTPRKTALVLRIGAVMFDLIVSGWRPSLDAYTFMDRADVLHTRIRDSKPAASQQSDERSAILKAAYDLVEVSGDPNHWSNPIPEASTISGTWWAL